MDDSEAGSIEQVRAPPGEAAVSVFKQLKQ